MTQNILTTGQIKVHISEMKKNTMFEVDQLVLMVDTQRSIIKMLQRGDYVDDLIEDMLSIDIPNQSHRYQDMFDAAVEYYQVLQESKDADKLKKEELKRRLDELSIPFSDNQAYHAFLAMERMAAGMGKSTHVIE